MKSPEEFVKDLPNGTHETETAREYPGLVSRMVQWEMDRHNNELLRLMFSEIQETARAAELGTGELFVMLHDAALYIIERA